MNAPQPTRFKVEDKPQPVYTDPESMLADMLDEAKEVNKRFRKNRDGAPTFKSTKGRSTFPKQVLAFVSANPGCTVQQIKHHLQASEKYASHTVRRMANDGRLRRWKDNDRANTPYRYEVSK